MISPVIVESRKGAVTAHCEHPGHPRCHVLYAGLSVRDAEQAAHEHLAAIRRTEAPTEPVKVGGPEPVDVLMYRLIGAVHDAFRTEPDDQRVAS